MKKLTGSDIITLIKTAESKPEIINDLKTLTASDFNSEDILVNYFFNCFNNGFSNAKFASSDGFRQTADAMELIKSEVSSVGLRKAYNLLQNIRNTFNEAVEQENLILKTDKAEDGQMQIKAAKILNFLSKYVDGNENKSKIKKALSDVHTFNIKNASNEVREVYSSLNPSKNVKLAFVTLKNQVGEAYQMCPKGIYNQGAAVPMALSNCREYCIDAKVNVDGTVGCNYLNWLNSQLITQNQALNLFDKMHIDQETMNLEKGDRSKFPMSDQNAQDSRIKRQESNTGESLENQLSSLNAKETKNITKKKTKVLSDKAIEALLKDTRDVFDDDELDTLEEQLRMATEE